MMPREKILNGKQLADTILNEVKDAIAKLNGRKPGIAVILVGDNPASLVYIKNKHNACIKAGIHLVKHSLASDTSEEKLLSLIHKLNQDEDIDAILLQLPLPKHLNYMNIIDAISADKDVDGFSRYNMGSLALNKPHISPCTPQGVMYLLDTLKLSYPGKHAVVVGSSNIVGRPLALELLNRGSTVTICNSKTLDITSITSKADILAIAIGSPKLVKAHWVKPGAVVIDIGINRLNDGSICGDVDFDDVIDKVAKITPVPGGVGPMTIAMLIKNTLRSFNAKISRK